MHVNTTKSSSYLPTLTKYPGLVELQRYWRAVVEGGLLVVVVGVARVVVVEASVIVVAVVMVEVVTSGVVTIVLTVV